MGGIIQDPIIYRPLSYVNGAESVTRVRFASASSLTVKLIDSTVTYSTGIAYSKLDNTEGVITIILNISSTHLAPAIGKSESTCAITSPLLSIAIIVDSLLPDSDDKLSI